MQSPRRTIDLRSVNRQTVLRRLYFDGPMSRLEISQHSRLSPATITNVVNDLLKEDIVIETGLVESEGGRPRTILAVNPQHGYFIGVDLGETHVQLDLFDLHMTKQKTARYLVAPQDNSPEQFIRHIVNGLDELLKTEGLKPEMILGVGVGLPGLVERGGKYNVSSPIWKWENVPFGEMLRSRITLPVFLDNGAKAMALAETWFGAGRGYQNLIVVLLGTGIGSGIITHGSLYRGPTNSAGELGHTVIVLDGRSCRCGSRGCLEAYAGAPGMIATLHDLAPDSPLLRTNDEDDDQLAILNNLVAAIEQGDPTAIETVRATAYYLSAAIANVVNLFNPEMIVVGGWVGLQIGSAILDYLREYVDQYALPPLRKVVQIEISQLGQDAICMGAACLVLDQFLAGNPKFMRKDPS